jgi:cell wall assembly regulator SMI1
VSPRLEAELKRLQGILATVDIELKTSRGASPADIAAIEDELAIQFDEDLRAFWEYTNGANGQDWFAVRSDEITGCAFSPISKAMEAWRLFEPYDKSVRELWQTDEPADERIRPGLLHHRYWFPIAQFNGFSTTVYFDANPAPPGRYGQIIVYQHDPDAIYYVADSFLDFFRSSNDLLAENLTQIFFLADEFERIVRMKGLHELERQLSAGLDVNSLNWRKRTLIQHAKAKGREDIVDFLSKRK